MPITDYPRYYVKLIYYGWENLGPDSYLTILISVAVIGYLWMRSSSR